LAGKVGGVELIIQLEHVNVARGNKVVLHDISLKVGAGEHLAILGPNGCGKSTLLKTMTCEIYPLVKPDMRVRILGRERWDLTQLKRKMGVVQAVLFERDFGAES
jgi:iron complex transport system ATP-binding protein